MIQCQKGAQRQQVYLTHVTVTVKTLAASGAAKKTAMGEGLSGSDYKTPVQTGQGRDVSDFNSMTVSGR